MNQEDLLEAIRFNDLAVVQELVEAQPELLDTGEDEEQSPIIYAAYHWKKEIMNYLVSQKTHLSFFEAVVVGDVEQVSRYLTEQPNLLHTYSSDGWTPLHLAGFFGHEDLTRLLLEKGADVKAISKNQMLNQPLHAAVAGRATKTSLLLIEAGAPIQTPQRGGYTPLLEAAQLGNIQLVERLLEYGADIAAQTDDGKDALDLAREKGHHEVMELLLKNKK